ncbi:Formyltransferase [Thozetella sp. PMI_491]|nr:Formyltransferase [Thozetella sp. PMI_491]
MSVFRGPPALVASFLGRRITSCAIPGLFRPRRHQSTSGKISDPLRILFCGSDEFSCRSLAALQAERMSNPGLIKSIDVVIRPPKRFGRGLKETRTVPAAKLAESLQLPVHLRDTFTGWSMPTPGNEPINLIIAVSFGLFVPPRLLRAAKYGGLNVHPSLLPDFRGPAPLQHAILNRRTHTGVSLQTLSEKTFDAGLVLAQTEIPGVPIPPGATFADLYEQFAALGAEMLVRGLRESVHVPPLRQVGWRPTADEFQSLRHAPKLGTADRQVCWVGKGAWGASDAVLRTRVTHVVWTRALDRDGAEKRMNFEGGLEVVPRNLWPQDAREFMRAVGQKVRIEIDRGVIQVEDEKGGVVETNDVGILGLKAVTWVQEDKSIGEDGQNVATKREVTLPYFVDGESIIVPTVKGDCLRISNIKVEGERSKPAARAIRAFSEDYTGHDDGKGFMGSLVDGLTLGVSTPVAWLEEFLP